VCILFKKYFYNDIDYQNDNEIYYYLILQRKSLLFNALISIAIVLSGSCGVESSCWLYEKRNEILSDEQSFSHHDGQSLTLSMANLSSISLLMAK
jgi:hypothetical protein